MGAVTDGMIARFLGGLATPRLFVVAATLLGLDLLIPDMIPFVDEILLAILTLMFARRKPTAPGGRVTRAPGTASRG